MPEKKKSNRLAEERSPYLLQHAYNPVDWYPWGDEAFEKARKENKLVLVSIGYAACHWCHVMEHESFEDQEVAELMNRHFVSVKVDREERPDVDQVYMDAVQLLTRSGGWPLNCFALPDGRPIYGGTYFTREQWLGVLGQLVQYAQQQPEALEEQAQKLTEGIRESGLETQINLEEDSVFSESDLEQLFANWEQRIDFQQGGSKGAPKFPLPASLQYLLHHHHSTGNPKALEALELTLDKMARGGIYDQLGGGFSRYSVDEKWFAPHFEKMLYDNAQLVSLYSAAFQTTGKNEYMEVVENTLAFIQRELSDGEGRYYSSLDADSEGVEGKFYIWTKAEIDHVLGKGSDLFCKYYNVDPAGNWEHGTNILYRTEDAEKLAELEGVTPALYKEKILHAKEMLFNERAKRIRPALDDKYITEWNGHMIKGFSDAYRAFGKKEYLESAIQGAVFIEEKIRQKNDGSLHRTYKSGKSAINAFLNDYAFVISGYISIYQASFSEAWLQRALDLAQYVIDHFGDSSGTYFYFTSDEDRDLLNRKVDLMDNVIASGNSEMAKNLYLLGHYFSRNDFIERAEKMAGGIKEHAIRSGTYFANWGILAHWMVYGLKELAILGPGCQEVRKEIDRNYLPDVILSGGEEEGTLPLLQNRLVKDKTSFYVCKDRVCQLPVFTTREALSLLKKDEIS